MAISFTTPLWILVYFYIVGAFSFVLSLVTVLLILFRGYKDRRFGVHMLMFQISSANTILQYTIFTQPISLFPILGGYCEGVLARFFAIWAHYLIGFLLVSVLFQIECLVFCFAIKHQSLARVISRHVLPENFYHVALFTFSFITVAAYICFCEAGMKREDQLAYIQNLHPDQFTGFSSLSNFAVYNFNHWFIVLSAMALIVGFFSALVFFLTTVDMHQMLKPLKLKVSSSSFKKYKIAVRSLFSQLAASLMLLWPMAGFLVTAVSQVDNAQAWSQLVLAICATHSIINAVILIWTTPQFRNILLQKSHISSFHVFNFETRNPRFVPASSSRNQSKNIIERPVTT